MNQNKRIVGYDYMRTISIFLVVIIHGNVAYLSRVEAGNMRLFALELTSMCMVAVPLFFMLSGALVVNEDCETLFVDLKKRLLKQGVPFIIWSILYVLARIAMRKIPFEINSFVSLLYEPAYYQFWFIYTLLAIYLLLPILNVLLRNISVGVYQYLLMIWSIFSIIQPTLAVFVPAMKLSEHIDLIICNGYLGYFLLGHFLHKYCENISQKKAWLMIAVGTFSTAILVWTEYTFAGDNFQGYFYRSYLTPNIVVFVCGIFLLFRNSKWKRSAIIEKLSSLSIGVFYVHMLVMTAVEYMGFAGYGSLIICFTKNLIVYITSLIAAYFISKIKKVRKVLFGM